MSKRTPQSVKASCDKLFSQLVRSRGMCQRCGETRYELLQTAHIYSRKFNSVRFDEDNAICLCARCHRWGHDNPTEFTDWLSSFVNLDALKVKKNVVSKMKLYNWLELEETLKYKLNETN